jgi:hypothetical protein
MPPLPAAAVAAARGNLFEVRQVLGMLLGRPLKGQALKCKELYGIITNGSLLAKEEAANAIQEMATLNTSIYLALVTTLTKALSDIGVDLLHARRQLPAVARVSGSWEELLASIRAGSIMRLAGGGILRLVAVLVGQAALPCLPCNPGACCHHRCR